jgi:hypothetical protein
MIDPLAAQIVQFARINAAMDDAAVAIRAVGASMARASRRIEWDLSIAFTDDPKHRRRLIRDRAREYRRPALIHKGGKP